MRIRFLSLSLLAATLAFGACKKEEGAPAAAAEQAAGAAADTAAKAADPAASADTPADTPAALPRPAEVTDEMEALADRMVGHLEAIAAAGTANEADCKKAGEAMTVAAEKARPDMEAAQAMEDKLKGNEAIDAWFKSKYESRMGAALPKLMGIAQKCAADPDFQKAMEAMSFMNG